MQTILDVWTPSREGLVHRLLKSACAFYLKDAEIEARFECGVADVMYKDTVIECLSKPFRSTVIQKIKQYQNRNLIFAVPSDTPEEVFEGLGVTVWFIDLTNGSIVEKRFEQRPEHLVAIFAEWVESEVKRAKDNSVDNDKLVKLVVNIPQWMANWIRKKAEEEGESVSVIIRRLLRKGIRAESGDRT